MVPVAVACGAPQSDQTRLVTVPEPSPETSISFGWTSMYCAAPGSVQPSAGKAQTVTAISEFVGDAAVAAVVADADVAGADAVAWSVAAPWVAAVREGGAWPAACVD